MAAPHPPPPAVFPCPVFEGSEKRISVSFAPHPTLTPHTAPPNGAPNAGAPTTPAAAGLRALPRPALDELLELAACQIVSARSSPGFDAYVLSESSLFVYPGGRERWVGGERGGTGGGASSLAAAAALVCALPTAPPHPPPPAPPPH